jgi:hypothetical protein
MGLEDHREPAGAALVDHFESPRHSRSHTRLASEGTSSSIDDSIAGTCGGQGWCRGAVESRPNVDVQQVLRGKAKTKAPTCKRASRDLYC